MTTENTIRPTTGHEAKGMNNTNPSQPIRRGVSRTERAAFYHLIKSATNARSLAVLASAAWLPPSLQRLARRRQSALLTADVDKHLRAMVAYLESKGEAVDTRGLFDER